jgi:hypothetical protein
MAVLFTFGDQSPTTGGDFERECCRRLRDELPDGVTVAANIELPRGGGLFYELDAVVSAPGLCEVLEFKCVRPYVDVYEDLLSTPFGFTVERVFSLVNRKAKVLADRLRRKPFLFEAVPLIKSLVVVPDDAEIVIRHDPYRVERPIKTISEAIREYRERCLQDKSVLGDAPGRIRNRNGWNAFHNTGTTAARSSHHLGRFVIRRRLGADAAKREYIGIDEAPCQVDVHLREYPFDPTLPRDELKGTLDVMAREFRILRRLRHPNVSCVVGHFQTGSSWVQVSDWFDGRTLEEAMSVVAELPLFQRLGIFRSIIAGLQFCHEKGVFHRNLDGRAVLIAEDLQEVRVCSFEYAFDVAVGSSMSAGRLVARDVRIVPPEELVGGTSKNLRLGDVFQSGVLLYRLLSGGHWPFESSLAFAVSEGQAIRACDGLNEDAQPLVALARKMMSLEPARRPDMLARVDQELQSLGAAQ